MLKGFVLKAELSDWREFARTVVREFPGGEDRPPQLAGQLFHACGKIDGWPNTGEIEPVAAADIAVEHIAYVQCQTKPQSRHCRACERRDVRLRLARGVEGATAHLG